MAKLPYQLLIFDWDGTIMDSEAKIVACIQHACRDLKLAEPGDAAVRDLIGLGLSEAYIKLYPHGDRDLFYKWQDRYRVHFHADLLAAKPFAGVTGMLNQLINQGYFLAVATGKSRRSLEKDLLDHDLKPFFAATRCVDEALSKPHPQMIYDVLGQLNIKPEHSLMIGDSVYDMELAQNANMAAVAVTCGVHTKEQLLEYKPLACLPNVAGLTNWLANQSV